MSYMYYKATFTEWSKQPLWLAFIVEGTNILAKVPIMRHKEFPFAYGWRINRDNHDKPLEIVVGKMRVPFMKYADFQVIDGTQILPLDQELSQDLKTWGVTI